jgi:DNA-binding response OmpR family regulator
MKILLIDDDKHICTFLKQALEEECFEVDVANDGEKGSFLGKTNEYDLIILDYALPSKDGKTICKELRKDDQNYPILMLSVQASPLTKAELLNCGADDYLAKPFSFEELLARVKALLRRAPEIKSDVIRAGNLTIDVNSQIVKKEGKEIDLTPKEYMLLEYLAKNKERVVSRAKIMEHVWDMNADMFSNTIEAHISNLRKKIDPTDKEGVIKSVSGRGYKIVN